jgi:hypothetical protein
LEGFCSTIELHPLEAVDKPTGLRPNECVAAVFRILPNRQSWQSGIGGGGWIRTNVGVSQQIYSLPPLTTRAPLRGEPQIMVAEQRVVKLKAAMAACLEATA